MSVHAWVHAGSASSVPDREFVNLFLIELHEGANFLQHLRRCFLLNVCTCTVSSRAHPLVQHCKCGRNQAAFKLHVTRLIVLLQAYVKYLQVDI